MLFEHFQVVYHVFALDSTEALLKVRPQSSHVLKVDISAHVKRKKNTLQQLRSNLRLEIKIVNNNIYISYYIFQINLP